MAVPSSQADAPLPAPVAEAPSGPRMFAVARVGRLQAAIASDSVVRAVPLPRRVLAVPRRGGAIEGVFDCDGQTLPLVRLGRWLDTGESLSGADTPTGDERVLVLRDGDRLIGLRVDAVVGVWRVGAHDVSRVHHDDEPEELFQSVIAIRAGEPGTLGVLEVGRLMALVRIWCPEMPVAAAAKAVAGADTQAAVARRGDALASFRIGDAVFAIRTADVHELIPFPPLEHGLPQQSAARGLCRWRGRIVPVVDLGRMLRAGADAQEPPWVCIVRHGDRTIGLLVHQVLELLVHDANAAPDDTTCEPPVSARVVGTHGGIVQVIDTAALMQRFPETMISAPRPGDAADRRQDAHHSNRTFVVFEAGTPYASPVDRVSEILDADEAVCARLLAGLPALLEWRGQAVPVLDLRARLATAARAMPAGPRQLLVMSDGDRRVALAIDRVRTIISAHTATRHRLGHGPGSGVEIVSVDTADHRASYQLLDLAQFLPSGEAVAGA